MSASLHRHFHGHPKHPGWALAACLALSCLSGRTTLWGATVDVSKLPPAAAGQVDFDRDIKPLFEKSCLRCHGPERPKGGFRLDESARALKGGENGPAIIPGQGDQSSLVHFAARLVEDMEMPPVGKGDPLTPQQVGLLRAWIDQGAKWGTEASQQKYDVSISSLAGFTTVSGNEAKFREHYGMPEGANGGIERLEFGERLGDDSKLTVKARALRDEYRVSLSLEKPKVGSIRVGWEQFRKYYNDVGGYHPGLDPSSYSLDRDLFLDTGKAWADFTLALPNWPVVTIGYEYQYRDGTKSLLAWGPVGNGSTTNNIFPAYKSLKESVHVLKLDLDHEFSGFRVQDQFRGQFFDLKTQSRRVTGYGMTAPGVTDLQDVREGGKHFQGANSIRIEKQFKDWIFGSAGYLFSHLEGDSSLGLVGTVWSFEAVPRNGDLVSQEIILDRQSHVVNINALLGPWEGFTLTAGAQSDWMRQAGFGTATLNTALIANESEAMNANTDRATLEETVALRYNKLPSTVLFAEAKLRQDSTDIYESQSGGLGFGYDFLRDTAVSGEMSDWRAGFSSSPWSRVTFGGHYRQKDYSDHFGNRIDSAFGGPNSGYSAFIRRRETLTDEIEGRCAVKVTPWLKSTLTYKWSDADYLTETDALFATPGGSIYSGDQNSQTFSLNHSITPWQRLYLGNTLTYRHSKTTTENNQFPAISRYRGDLYSILATATYVLTETTDLTASYNYSKADFGQANFVDGLPLGLDYELHGVQTGLTWRFRKNTITRLQYGFYNYDEKNTGGWNNYTAHALFAMLTIKLP
ncbi:MAG: hypothetical protein JNN07_01930 [Verrucomicrobiales bacterium]|nr:hypothetical protein [Verrucomicrobiales bacterium]